MMIDLNKLKAACLARGDLPDACKGCPANDNNTTGPVYGSDYTSFPRCKLLCPRAWNIATIENAAHQFLCEQAPAPAPAPKCSKCKYSQFHYGRLWCYLPDITNMGDTITPVTVLFDNSCNWFQPSAQYETEFTPTEQA